MLRLLTRPDGVLCEDWLVRHTCYEAMQQAQAQHLPRTAVHPPLPVLQEPLRQEGHIGESYTGV